MAPLRFLAGLFTRPVLTGLALGLVCWGRAGVWAWAVDRWLHPAPLPEPGAPTPPQSALVGKPAPLLRLPALLGDRTVDLSELRGRPVVLVFSSFSCKLFDGHLEHLGRL